MNSEANFKHLGLAEPILRAIAEVGYDTPTPIQRAAIPHVLAGRDLLAAAQTGTGKTAGFTLPLLHRLAQSTVAQASRGQPRCLILTPTRELTAQVGDAVKQYSRHLQLNSLVIFGGVNIKPQIDALQKRVDVLIATPGRLLDHCRQGTVDLSAVSIFVLDEADRMLDMGFIHDIRKVLALLPAQRQNLLFSATFSADIRKLAQRFLHDPATVDVSPPNTTAERVQQAVYMIGQKQKRELLAHLIKEKQWFQALVFTRTKHGANRLAEYLSRHDIGAAAIHGNKSQAARTRALSQFKDGRLPVLVATDIAARGLDIDQLPQVVNFELPNVPEDYVHRIGRTGRAGADGHAISLVDAEEVKLLGAIERLIKQRIERVVAAGFTPSANAEAAHDADHRRAPLPRRQSRPTARAGHDSTAAPRGGRRSEGARKRPASTRPQRDATRSSTPALKSGGSGR